MLSVNGYRFSVVAIAGIQSMPTIDSRYLYLFYFIFCSLFFSTYVCTCMGYIFGIFSRVCGQFSIAETTCSYDTHEYFIESYQRMEKSK